MSDFDPNHGWNGPLRLVDGKIVLDLMDYGEYYSIPREQRVGVLRQLIDQHTEVAAAEPLLVTASQVGRLMACSGGASLIKVSDLDNQEASEAGTEAHEKILISDTGTEGAFLWRWLHADFGEHPPDAKPGLMFSSVEYARYMLPLDGGKADHYRPTVAVPVGRLSTPRAYRDAMRGVPRGTRWIVAGTSDADAYVKHENGTYVARLGDLKTGHAQIHAGALEEPQDAWQLRTNSVLLWVSLGRPKMVLRLAWFCYDVQDKYGWVREAPMIFTETDLGHWEVDIVDRMDALARGEGAGEFARGDHCRYCSGFLMCPAQREALSRVAQAPLDDLTKLSDEEIAYLWADLQTAENHTERARKAFTALVERAQQVPVGQGKVLVAARNLNPKWDLDKLKARVKLEYGTDDICKETATLETIRRGIAATGAESEAVETFLKMIEEEGIIHRVATRPFLAERKQKKEK